MSMEWNCQELVIIKSKYEPKSALKRAMPVRHSYTTAWQLTWRWDSKALGEAWRVRYSFPEKVIDEMGPERWGGVGHKNRSGCYSRRGKEIAQLGVPGIWCIISINTRQDHWGQWEWLIMDTTLWRGAVGAVLEWGWDLLHLHPKIIHEAQAL